MKKITLLFLMCGLLFSSCEKKLPLDEIEQNVTSEEVESSPLLLKSSEYFDWESTQTIIFGNGEEKTLPFYNGPSTTVPDFITQDYKKEDGWELLYNFCTSNIDLGKNYLIFYNKFTGVIRTYYYLDDLVTSGNEGMWSLDLTNTSALLNNVDYFAKPINKPRFNPVSVSTTISKNAVSKAIARGWNCFDTEITYDPSASSKSIKMSIIPYDNNISQIVLEGEYQSKSEGTIITSGSKNPAQDLEKNVAKAAGNEAGKWIKGIIGGEDDASAIIKLGASAVSSILSGGTTEIVKAGLNLVFGSFIGRFNKPTTTTQKIEFKTNGTITMSGALTSTSASNALSVANLYFPNTLITFDDIFPHYNKSLGVWNIDKTPIVKVSKKAYLAGGNNGLYYYSRDVILDHSSFNVIINPEVLALVDEYEVSSEIMYYKMFQGNQAWRGSSNPSPRMSNGPIYKDSQNEFYRNPKENYAFYYAPDYTPEPGQISEMPYMWYDRIDYRYVVKVSVKLYPKAPYSTEPIVLTRSYLPNYVLYNTTALPTFPPIKGF